jgi:hypothetical protein
MIRWDRLFRCRKRMMEDLDQDIRDYVERETQDNIERGLPPEEARYAALRKSGHLDVSPCRKQALPGTRTTPNTFLLVALFMNARIAIQFGVTHFLEICGVCYRVFTASPPMRLSRPGSPQTDDFGSLLSWC